MTFNFSEEVREVIDLLPLLQENPTIDQQSHCTECPLDGCIPLAVQGEGRLRILVVLSNPTKGDMDMGRYSTSQPFLRLAHDLSSFGVDIDKDCWVTSAVRCYPNGKVPSKKMFECCRGKLLSTVRRLKPTIVLLAGRNAVHGWIGHQFSVTPRMPDNFNSYHDMDYDMWTGHTIPDHTYAFEVDGKMVCPTVIPLFNTHDVAKTEQENMRRGTISSVVPIRHRAILAMATDMAKDKVNKGVSAYAPYTPGIVENVQIIKDEAKAIGILRALNTPSILALDYETTGLKPYDEGHAIRMVGLADGKHSYAIPMFMHNPDFLQAYKNLMTNPKVKKVCHNLKFEYNWTRKILGYEMEGVLWDTMLVAHILDMRDGLTGLKVQGYLKFGIAGYEKVTKKLLASREKGHGANGKNWLEFLDPRHLDENAHVWNLLLQYVGSDAALTRELYLQQKSELMTTDTQHLMKGIKLFMESTITLAEMEYNGFVFDSEQCAKNRGAIKERMAELKVQMKKTAEYEKWVDKYPDKVLNTNSPKQLQEFLYDILGHPVTKLSKSGNPSTDKDALEQVGSEFTGLLLEYKALDKMLNSFLKGYEAETNDDGHLRCFFNLNNVKSYRTSSSNVNLQNVSHHSNISQYALNLLKPLPGHVLLNADFKALEVSMSACHNHDPKLLEYLHDASTDMHRDVACDIHFYEPEDLPKRLRTLAKRYVFGAFYGAGYKSIAVNQWKDLTAEDKQRLKEHGISGFLAFEQHIKVLFDRFWQERFREFTRWKRTQWNFYTKYGYFVGHTGFLYTGICNMRQTSNFGTQGDASHILLQMANHVYAFMKRHSLDSRSVGQVHDSLVISCVPEEVTLLCGSMQEFLKQLPIQHPWTSDVDFVVEVEKSEVDGHWGAMKEYVSISGSAITQLGD